MNVANKLTILRIVLTPVFLVLMLLDFIIWRRGWCLARQR